MSNFSSIKFHVHISSTDVCTEIFDTGYCRIVHLSFLTSHNLLFFKFCKTLTKKFRFFCRFFSHKFAQISIFKVEYLENKLADFNDFGLILQDFERSFRLNQLVLALQFSFNGIHLCFLCIFIQENKNVHVISTLKIKSFAGTSH